MYIAHVPERNTSIKFRPKGLSSYLNPSTKRYKLPIKKAIPAEIGDK